MRTGILVVIPALLLSAGCGRSTLALPDDPVDRAATCGVVAAARARATQTDLKAVLPFEAQGAIMHPAMLVAAEGDGFVTDTAAAVVKRMPELEEKITSGKFETLAEPCRQAFPQTAVTQIQLPADAFEARMGCFQLGGFLVRALKDTGESYGDQLSDYGSLRDDLDKTLAVDLKAKGVEPRSDAAEKLRKQALAKATRLGPPMEVMKACVAKYGDKA